MKKIVSLFLCLILVLSSLTITSAASINKYEREILNLLNTHQTVGTQEFSWPASYVNQAENYFLKINLTKHQRDIIVPLLKSSYSLLKANKDQIIFQKGTKNIKYMSQKLKTKLLSNAAKAGLAAGLLVTFNGRNLVIRNKATNKLVFSAAPIIKVTGSDTNYVAAASVSAASLALLSFFIFMLYRRRKIIVKENS
ncbi:MAG: hypothetical protein WC677_04980 [Clostridia bacterium]